MNKDLLAIFDEKAWNKKIFQFIYNDVCVPRYKTLCIYEALFGGRPRACLDSMNIGKLEDGASTEEQPLEVLGGNYNQDGNNEGRQQRQAQYHFLLRRL